MSGVNERSLGRRDRGILRRVRSLAEQYQDILSQPRIEATAVIENRDKMVTSLEKARLTESPEIILAVEATILQVDRQILMEHIEGELSAGCKIPRETKYDLTQLNDGIQGMDDSHEVFRMRRLYGEAAYHDISVKSRQQKETEVDKNGTAVDVLRKNTKSHETRLSNMASASSTSEIGRKNQLVYSARRQNMIHCRNLYIANQKEFAQSRKPE